MDTAIRKHIEDHLPEYLEDPQTPLRPAQRGRSEPWRAEVRRPG